MHGEGEALARGQDVGEFHLAGLAVDGLRHQRLVSEAHLDPTRERRDGRVRPVDAAIRADRLDPVEIVGVGDLGRDHVAVHAILQESPRKRAARTRADTPALLKGLLFGPDGAAFSPTHTRKGDRLYRYYVSQTVLKHGAGSCPIGRVPAGEIEAAVIG